MGKTSEKKEAASNQTVSCLIHLKRDMKRNWSAYLLFLPVLLYYLIFCYKPMYGLIIAFKDFTPYKGIMESPWAKNNGLYHFITFFKSVYFGRLIKNTLVISITNIAVTFPAFRGTGSGLLQPVITTIPG